MSQNQFSMTKGWIIVLLLVCPLLVKAQQVPFPVADQDFSRFAWEMFIYANQPYDGGHPLWESWATISDVFGDPGKEPIWVGRFHRESRQQPIRQLEFIDGQSNDPSGCRPQIHAQDVRLNGGTFLYIRQHYLWNLEGQERAFKLHQGIFFPPDAIEVKAIWVGGITGGQAGRFYTRTVEGQLEGLAGLHIIAKQHTKHWIWMTFEHVDNSCRCHFIPCADSFGAAPQTGEQTLQLIRLFRRAGMASQWEKFWQYFRLTGVQTFFVDRSEKPTRLGNSIPEFDFGASSSCISCHFRSAVNLNGQRPTIVDPKNNCTGFIGYPRRSDFYDNQGHPLFWRLDYVWSLMEAKSATGRLSGPSMCQHVPSPH